VISIDIHLVKAIVDMAIFLEFSNSDLLNEDAAVEAMEQLAGELQQMPEADLRALSSKIVSLASTYSAEQKAFVEALPEALGLV
jgi:hypothetical protein